MSTQTDIDTLFKKIVRPVSDYQELTSLRKTEMHASRWKLLHEIHLAYQNSSQKIPATTLRLE